MNIIVSLILVALIAIAIAFLALPRLRASSALYFANIAEGTHINSLGNLRADAAIATRHLLVKRGSDANHFAVCGAGDLPLGPCPDEPAAAEDVAEVTLLGIKNETVLMVAAEIIAIDSEVFTAASGKIQDTPVAPGTYYSVGYGLTAGVADGLVEVRHHAPRKLVVT